eukprot:TRINITY_DN34486_c0_g1_i1.p1 TRINITY_DN34486_c0_g1~~TRINITY_DN34486_c0_g1_i1.p1  ORF type:complete len:201 (+),score=28.83 TRINITY_DN34486_c0_g1_i1:44-604(+)
MAGFNTIAFEPMQYNTELLDQSIQLSSLQSRVSLFRTAVGAERGADMCIEPPVAGRNLGNGQLKQNCSSTAELVPLSTIDDILAENANFHHVCFAAIKLDVEGFEASALLGAKKMMTGFCPPCAVFFEYDVNLINLANLAASQVDMWSLMDQWGYQCLQSSGNDHTCLLTRQHRCSRLFQENWYSA